MKKTLKIIGIILVIIIILGLIFFIVDYNLVKKQEKPIFCIKNPAGTIRDGGTIEYFGLGYKVIDFNTLGGYKEIKIGSWFMDYDDFSEEIQKVEEENRNEEFSFCGIVTKVEENLFFVKPDANEEIARSADLVMVGKLKNDTDIKIEVGEKIRIIYDGMVMTTYPAQINAIRYEKVNE